MVKLGPCVGPLNIIGWGMVSVSILFISVHVGAGGVSCEEQEGDCKPEGLLSSMSIEDILYNLLYNLV